LRGDSRQHARRVQVARPLRQPFGGAHRPADGRLVRIMKVETYLRGREIQSRAQLNAVFKELEERIGPLLDSGARVRLS
jgi:hypothetical protein